MPARDSKRPPRPTKTCEACGRPMTWRKRWERCWDLVKYCSDACRKRKSSTSA